MSERRFLELLNLYIDEQISAAEAAELESEVLSNPERRLVYDEYCRLQRACCLLGESARQSAPSSAVFARSLRDAERKIATPRLAPWRPSTVGLFSTAAMAACIALVFVVNQRPEPLLTGGELVAENNESGNAPVVAAPVMVSVPVHAAPATPASPIKVLALDVSPEVQAVARNAREAEIASTDREALEWMQRVDLLPVSRVIVDEWAFESRPVLHTDHHVFRSRPSIPENAEFTAFQFQR